MLELNVRSKRAAIYEIEAWLKEQGFGVTLTDYRRPWGAFWYIDTQETPRFLKTFFEDVELRQESMQPKILLVAPELRLSWQYHLRRSEIWNVVHGPVGVMLSRSDKETKVKEYQDGGQVEIPVERRHRLIGVGEWGVVAEVWVHTDADNPSDEDDIVRISDDFGRALQNKEA